MSKVGLKKGQWTHEEDKKLIAYVTKHGHGNWNSLPSRAGLQRYGKSCRLRWINYLKPDIKRGNFSLEEERNIIQLHALVGNKWSTIAAHLPKRTDNEIKNHWNSVIKKRLIKMGIDPITHKPKSNNTIEAIHMAEWESIRVEAEARSSSMLSSTTSTPPARLILSKVPNNNINAMYNYNMCGIMLATNFDDDSDFQVPLSTLSFPSNVDHFTETSLSISYEGDSNNNNNNIIVETSGHDNMMVMDGYVSCLQEDDDIMVANVMEEFRGARCESNVSDMLFNCDIAVESFISN